MEAFLRPIEKKDNAAMQMIVKKSLEEFGLDRPGTAYFDPELEDLTQAYDQEKAGYWVLELAGGVIGGVGVFPHVEKDGRSVAEMQKLYIDRDFRGRGFARPLIEQAIAFARENYDALYLETSSDLQVDRLYEHFNFQKLDGPVDGGVHPAMDLWYIMNFD